MPDLHAALHAHFGHRAFRPGQEAAIEAVTGPGPARDVLVVMPTGAGKSLCHQLPALMRDDLTVVVSPLVSLMTDQVDGLRRRGIAGVAAITGQQDARENAMALEAAASGALRLLHVAPERFRAPGVLDRLRGAGVGLFVVDEAHCVSQWGHDFRPDYLRLAAVARGLGAAAVIASTATATPAVAAEIVRRLDLRDPVRVSTGFDRPNLALGVERCVSSAARTARIADLLADPTMRPAIVYSGTRRGAERLAGVLAARLGIPVPAYHAGLHPERRAAVQAAFMGSAVDVVVATNAFGMGIDKADVRTVVHDGAPGSLEAYYQEAGRAGRDGLPAHAFLLAAPADRGLQAALVRRAADRARVDDAADAAAAVDDAAARRARWAQLRAMQAYVDSRRCRRTAILRHFGDATAPVPTGVCCDVCAERGARVRAPAGPTGRRAGAGSDLDAAILTVVGAARVPLTCDEIAAAVRGERGTAVRRRHLDGLPGYGTHDDASPDLVGARVAALLADGRLRLVPGGGAGLVVAGPPSAIGVAA